MFNEIEHLPGGFTVTPKVQSVERSPESVQVHVTVVVPTSKKEPDIRLQSGGKGPSCASVQGSISHVTKFPMFPEKLITGFTAGQTGVDGGVLADVKGRVDNIELTIILQEHHVQQLNYHYYGQ